VLLLEIAIGVMDSDYVELGFPSYFERRKNGEARVILTNKSKTIDAATLVKILARSIEYGNKNPKQLISIAFFKEGYQLEGDKIANMTDQNFELYLENIAAGNLPELD
jgi:hypothetical protein